jgi:hypothetical protein
MDRPDFLTVIAKFLNVLISGALISLFHSFIVLDTPPVEIPISLEIESLVLPLRYPCISSALVERAGIVTYLVQYIMIKNLYKENGNSRRHFFGLRRQTFRHKSRHFNNPSTIVRSLSEAVDIILIEVIDIQKKNFDSLTTT